MAFIKCILLLPIFSSSINTASYPLLEYGSPVSYIYGNVDCHGNESRLSECTHLTMDCDEGVEEAGVICTGECHFISNTIAVYNLLRCGL